MSNLKVVVNDNLPPLLSINISPRTGHASSGHTSPSESAGRKPSTSGGSPSSAVAGSIPAVRATSGFQFSAPLDASPTLPSATLPSAFGDASLYSLPERKADESLSSPMLKPTLSKDATVSMFGGDISFKDMLTSEMSLDNVARFTSDTSVFDSAPRPTAFGASGFSMGAHMQTGVADTIPEEIKAKLWNIFSLVDVDKNGYIDRSEVENIMRTVAKKNASKEEIEKLFLESDTNRDGVISFEEFSHNMFSWLKTKNLLESSLDVPALLKSFTVAGNYDDILHILSSDIAQDFDYENVLGLGAEEIGAEVYVNNTATDKMNKLRDCLEIASNMLSISAGISSPDLMVQLHNVSLLRTAMSIVAVFPTPRQRSNIANDLLQTFQRIAMSGAIQRILPLLSDTPVSSEAELQARGQIQAMVLEVLFHFVEGPYYYGMPADSLWHPKNLHAKQIIIESDSRTLENIITLCFDSPFLDVKSRGIKCLCILAAHNIQTRDLICKFLVHYQVKKGVPLEGLQSVIFPLILTVKESSSLPIIMFGTRLMSILCGHTQSELMSNEDWQKMGGIQLLAVLFDMIPVTNQTLPPGYGPIVTNLILSLKYLLPGTTTDITVAKKLMGVLQLSYSQWSEAIEAFNSVASCLFILMSTDATLTAQMLRDGELQSMLLRMLDQICEHENDEGSNGALVNSMGRTVFLIIDKMITQNLEIFLLSCPQLLVYIARSLFWRNSNLYVISANSLLLLLKHNSGKEETFRNLISALLSLVRPIITDLFDALVFKNDATIPFDFEKSTRILQILKLIFDCIAVPTNVMGNPVLKYFGLDSAIKLKVFLLDIIEGKTRVYFNSWSSNKSSADIIENAHYLLNNIGTTYERLLPSGNITAREICATCKDALDKWSAYVSVMRPGLKTTLSEQELASLVHRVSGPQDFPIHVKVNPAGYPEVKVFWDAPARYLDFVKEVNKLYGRLVNKMITKDAMGNVCNIVDEMSYQTVMHYNLNAKHECMYIQIEFSDHNFNIFRPTVRKRETLIKIRSQGFQLTRAGFYRLVLYNIQPLSRNFFNTVSVYRIKNYLAVNNYYNVEMQRNQFYTLFHEVTNIKDLALLEQCFVEFDTNNSGSVSAHEILIGLTLMLSGRVNDRIEMAFSAFDADNNGAIDRKELAFLVFASTGMDKMRAYELSDKYFFSIGKADPGFINLEEFRYGVTEIKELIEVFWNN